ncbi:MAG: hypothetical protein AB1746_01570 [Candidatus Zixiibacteriota bacterium]
MASRIIISALMLWCLFSSAPASENPSILGIDFPSLDGDIQLAAGDTILYTPYPLQFDIHFYLSSTGTVDSFSFSPPKREIYINKIGETLRRLRFFPPRIGGNDEPFILAGEIGFRAVFNRPRLFLNLPFDEPSCELNFHLVEKTLRLNGYELPKVARFPSYFCFQSALPDSLAGYPFVIFEIDVDSAGNMVDYSQIFTNRADCAALLSNVLLYTQFLPPSHNGKPFAAKFYLVVRFFRSADYPTAVWTSENALENRDVFEMKRIEVLPYLGSIANPPYPINAFDGDYFYNSVISFKDSVDIMVHIDSLGRVGSTWYQSYTHERLRHVIDDVLKKFRFTPATRPDGERVGFDGRLRFEFDNSKNIRIQPAWLPPIISKDSD